MITQRTLCAHYTEDGTLILQEAAYIEDGWYIEMKNNVWSVYEIPFAADARFIEKFDSLEEALEETKKLT